MKISLILSLLFVTVTVAFVTKNDKNVIHQVARAIEEMYQKHPEELKNFGPFLKEYYRNLPKTEDDVVLIDDNELSDVVGVSPLEIETVFADFDQDDYRL